MSLPPAGWPQAVAEAAVVPALMVADYYLTLWSRVVLEREYLQRFRVEEYELNPLWRKDVARQRWFNPRHLALALLAWGCVALLLALCGGDEALRPWGRFLVGGLVVPFGMVVARHLVNLASGRRLERNPGEVRGAVQVDLSFLLATSRYQVAGLLLPLGLAALWVRDPFLWGGLAGSLSLVAAHYRWGRRSARVSSPGGSPPAA